MRVLLIDVNCKNSSTGKIVYDLYTGIIENGDEAAICYGRGALVKGTNIYKFGLDWETNVHALLTRITGLTGCYSFFSTRRLIKFINEFKPDVVHIHELHAYFVNIATLLRFLAARDVPVVWTFHCEFMYTGKCGYAYNCEKWKVKCGDCPRVREYPSSLFFDFTKRMYQEKKKLIDHLNILKIVTPSAWLANRVKQSFVKNKDIQVIHNGVDTDIFYPRKFEHLKHKHNITDQKIALAVAPNLMSERKGGRWVLELAKRLENERIKFILIGIDDLSEEFPQSIIALGKIENQHELADYYSMADVFVICSEKETFALTCAEALCCGTPVVGFRSGAPETVFEGQYAKFVEYGDLNSLKDVLIETTVNDTDKTSISLLTKNQLAKQRMLIGYINAYNDSLKKC